MREEETNPPFVPPFTVGPLKIFVFFRYFLSLMKEIIIHNKVIPMR